MPAAVELEDKVSQKSDTYLVNISGIINNTNFGNIPVVQFLVSKSSGDFYFYKLDNFKNPVKGLKSLLLFDPQNWQKIDLKRA
jgi:hypothetical protein